MILKKVLVFFVFSTVVGFYLRAQDQSGQRAWYNFSEDGKECIVHNADLPTPWLNRLSNDVFTTWVTHNGFIESFLLDQQWNGLTNPQNTSGRFYIRDKENGSVFQVNKPVKGGQWESRVGLGYNTVSQQSDGIKATVTYFVPRNDNVLLMMVEVENTSAKERSLDVFSEVEWNLGDPVKSFIYRGDGRAGSQFNLYKKVEMENNALIARQRTWKNTGGCEPWPFTGYFSVSEPVVSYECVKDNFLGLQRNYDDPQALKNEKLTNTSFWSRADYPVGVLHNTIKVPASGKKILSYQLGMIRNEGDLKGAIGKYASVGEAEKALQDVHGFYDKLVSQSVTIETPDKDNDRILNIWNKYQWRQFFKKSENTGEYGMGLWSYNLEGETIRAAAEQVILPFDTDIIESMVIEQLKNQMSDTSQTDICIGEHTMLYKDLGLNGPDSAHRGRELITHRHKISEYFYPLYYYLLETGDLELMNKTLPYIDGKQGTVWEHVQTAMTIATRIVSERGLPKIPTGHGDWMDEFTKISRNNSAESEMLACELGFILKGFIDVAKRTNHLQDAEKWTAVYDKMKKALNDLCWDGEWYLRAFSDLKTPMIPVGSHNDTQGSIYLNAQSWPILSEMATPERAKTSMLSVKKRLISDFGPLIFTPSYNSYVDHIGTQSIYAPGFRNGCIYLRPAGWAIMASTMVGESELAYEMYTKASLATRGKTIEQFECEPYVYTELYNGPDHALKGRGEFQWNLGEGASWMWYSYVGYILGVRSEIDGLRIDPKAPADWKGYKVKRNFRGSVYDIEVKNTSKTSGPIRSITVDGKKIKGNLIKPGEKGKTYKVSVVI